MAGSRAYDDTELFCEDVGAIEVGPNPTETPPVLVDRASLDDPFPYHSLFPWIPPDIVGRELAYWNAQFFAQKKLADLIAYLRAFPLSKRAILILWKDEHRDLSKNAPCEIAIFFRLKDHALEMHTHMRADNASFLLFMDMRVLTGIQAHVARELGVSIGTYIHFIDSVHIYVAERHIAIKQRSFISRSPLWNMHKKTNR